MDQWNGRCEQSGNQMIDGEKYWGWKCGCGWMLGLWLIHGDLEPILEWDCALPPPPFPPALLQLRSKDWNFALPGCFEKGRVAASNGC